VAGVSSVVVGSRIVLTGGARPGGTRRLQAMDGGESSAATTTNDRQPARRSRGAPVVRGADIVGAGDNDRSVSLVRGSLPCRLTVGDGPGTTAWPVHV
jgi:hypothetical protein